MTKRLEDVSHFFLGNEYPSGQSSPAVPPSQIQSRRPLSALRTIACVSDGDDLTAAMVVSGFAVCAVDLGYRVVVGQTHEHAFGVGFGLNGRRMGVRDQSANASPREAFLRVLPSFSSSGRLREFLDSPLGDGWNIAGWDEEIAFIHVNHDPGRMASHLPPYDGIVILGGSPTSDGLVRLYQALKRVAARNSNATIWILPIRLEENQNHLAVWRGLACAIERYLMRRCEVLRSVTDDPSLGSLFLGGEFRRIERRLVTSVFEPTVTRLLNGVPSHSTVAGTEAKRPALGPAAQSTAGEHGPATLPA